MKRKRTSFLGTHGRSIAGPVVSFALGLVAILYFKHVGDRQREARLANEAAIHSLMQGSEVRDPVSYFEDLVRLLHGENSASVAYPDLDGLKFEPLSNGKCVLALTTTRQLQNEGRDLGLVGKELATKDVSAIAWITADQIRNVEKIKVKVGSFDAGLRGGFLELDLTPDASFAKNWSGPTDPELARITAGRIVVVEDTLSGKHWESVP